MENKSKIVMLPTKDVTDVILSIIPNVGNKLYYSESVIEGELRGNSECKHLYEISDTEIEDDEWVLCLSTHYNNSNHPSEQYIHPIRRWCKSDQCTQCKKIISTTDESLNLTCKCGSIKKVHTGLCINCCKFTKIQQIDKMDQSVIKDYCYKDNIENLY